MPIYIIPSVMLIISGIYSQQDKNIISYENKQEDFQIQVYADEKSGKPITRNLYGKFTEHLGRNIYGGMWAQILQNPGFEGWKYWGRDSEDRKKRIRHYTGRFGLPDIAENYEKNTAPWWIPYGRGDIDYQMNEEAFNSEYCQKIVLESLQSQQAGVAQPLFLPTHRQSRYEFSFYAKVEKACKIHISIRGITDEDRILAETTVDIDGKDWKRYTAGFELSEKLESGTPVLFVMGLTKPNTLYLDQMALFPVDHIDGFDPDVINMIKDSKLPLLRYPGGNFVSGYRWKDGIGPIDQRKTTLNWAWNMIEYNHVGTDEFMAFCKAAETEPMICLNAGDGSPEEAAQWLEYCNGSTDKEYGALRAKNGHPEPYNVKYWEIGNELYGGWQIGHCSPEEYAHRYEKFYKAMKAVDPDILIIANGQDKKWNAPIVREKPGILRSLSIHTLIGGGTPDDADPDEVFESLMAYTFFYKEHLKELAEQMGQTVDKPMFAITELQIFTNKPMLPNNSTLSEALFWSGIVNTCIRLNGLVEMVTHSALVNHGGGLRKEREIVYANPVYYARKLYSTQSATIPVRTNISCPMFKSTDRYTPESIETPYLDAVSLLSDDGKELNVIVSNRHPKDNMEFKIILDGFKSSDKIKVKTITGKSYMDRNTWDNQENVKITETEIDYSNGNFSIPAHSIVMYLFDRD
ncbi:hypothetical protein GF312_12225 [Candidatus Poribacteria bacterium]|nr:hypothetical protein [Candidatus Poribacteria bacterium]